MINLQTITNVTDCVPLYLPHSLYLKPVAKLSLSVGLPPNKMGKSISNFDIMDKLTKALAPDKFLILKVTKSTLEIIRLEAELEEPNRLPNALARLDGMSFKVPGFSENFKVRAKELKDEFPNRHDWDTFFRDAHYMDEMKCGERPDTIHFANFPIRWFCPRHVENDENVKPSENIFKRIFEKFGPVRGVDIPICDALRQKMSSDVNGIQYHNFEQDILFEGYVQFEEYIGFVRAMDEFRGMKLVRKFVDKTQAINIIVNFDKKKHLSEASILRRERMRKSLLAKVKSREEEEEKQKKKEQERIEKERKLAEEIKLKELERQREREEQRKQKHLKKLQEKGQLEISRKIRLEEKKLLIVRRKLESIRVLEALFERLKVKDLLEKGKSVKTPSIDLRQRLVDKYKSATEKLLDEQKKRLESERLQTGLSGLLKHGKGCEPAESSSANGSVKENGKKKKKAERQSSESSSSSSDEEPKKKNEINAGAEQIFNPFKGAYTQEAAAELMKMSMLSYGVFPGMPVYRPSFPPAHHGMRGYIPRGRGGGMRGPRRGGYNYHGSSGGYPYTNYYNDYRHDGGNSHDYSDRHGSGYRNSRSYSRSRSRKRSRSRSRTHSRSRSRSRHRRYSRSRRSRSRSHSRSLSRSRSRSHRNRTHDRSTSRSQSRNRERRSRNRSRSVSNVKSRRSKSQSRNQVSRSRSRSESRTRTKRSRSVSKVKKGSDRGRSKSKSHSLSKSKQKSNHRPSSSRERGHSKASSDSKSRKKSGRESKVHHSSSRSGHKSHKTKSRSKSRSSLKNKSATQKTSKELVSTRRSHSPTSWSRSPSEPRRSWSDGVEPEA